MLPGIIICSKARGLLEPVENQMQLSPVLTLLHQPGGMLCFTELHRGCITYKLKARHSTSKKIAMALLQYSIISVVWTGTCNISQVCSTHPNHTHSPLPYVFSIKGWKTLVRNVKTLFSVHGWLNP